MLVNLITTDQKVFSEESESRDHHRFAVVVQDLAAQWNAIVSVQNRNFAGDPEELNEVPGADEETKSRLHWQLFGIWQVLPRNYLGIILRWHHTDQHQIICRKSSAQSERRDICGAIACGTVWVTNGGRILWNVTAICKTFKISCLMVSNIWKAVRDAI